MGFRFRRTISLFPGVRLNISRGGLSTSIGTRGATLTLGRGGVYGNVGIPGSGLSYRTRLAPRSEPSVSIIEKQDAFSSSEFASEPNRKISRYWMILPIVVLGIGLSTLHGAATSPPTQTVTISEIAAPAARLLPTDQPVSTSKTHKGSRTTKLKHRPSQVQRVAKATAAHPKATRSVKSRHHAKRSVSRGHSIARLTK